MRFGRGRSHRYKAVGYYRNHVIQRPNVDGIRRPQIRVLLVGSRLARTDASDVFGNRTFLRCDVTAQVEKHLVHIAPTPTLRGIVTLDDGVVGRAIVMGGVLPRRLIAAAHMSARAADPQVHPGAAASEALLAALGARPHLGDVFRMTARVHERSRS